MPSQTLPSQTLAENAERLAVSSWSLHRRLGLFYHETPEGRVSEPRWGAGETTLLALPSELAAHGIGKLEICHFHFPHLENGYLTDLRASLAESGIAFFTLLIDAGDITHPNPTERERDIAMIEQWIDIAAQCGAARVRVIAGDAALDPSGGALTLSVQGLDRLARRAVRQNVRVVIENWHALTDKPAEVLELLNRLDGSVGLLADFGNWPAPRKYDDLPFILPFAESTHAKAYFPGGVLDREDYVRCLDLCRAVGLTGPHSLIYDSPGDEWDGIERIKSVVLDYPGAK